jgi:hypothetical protein|tara:strand:+ start:226 stop:450 length:225 start_codon:yes stop_codon:yes gene_type:complete
MLNFLTISILFISQLFSYEVGETVTSAHQNMDFNICYGNEHDLNGDGIFNFAEYNGDLNGGQYYVIFLEMMTTW